MNTRTFGAVAAAMLFSVYATASPKNGLDKNRAASSERDLQGLEVSLQDSADAVGNSEMEIGDPRGNLERVYRGDQSAHLGFTWTDDYGEYRVLVPSEDAPSEKSDWLMINLRPRGQGDGLDGFDVGVVACDGGTTLVLEKGAKVDVQVDREHHLVEVQWTGHGDSGGQRREFSGKLLARIAFKGESAIFAWRQE